MFDLAVIGAGPAGATIARLLGKKFKVALFEKHVLNSAPGAAASKCCGGLLAPDAQRALARAGLGLPREVTASPQLFVVRCLDAASGLARNYQRHYLNINRGLFDRWLCSLIPERVYAFWGSRVTAVRRGERGYILHYTQGEKTLSLEARTVVGADGALSLLRRTLGGNARQVRRYFVLQEALPRHEPFAAYTAVFDPAVTDYYAWLIPKNDRLLLGAALDPSAQPLARFQKLKETLGARGLIQDRPFERRSAFLLRPRGSRDVFPGHDNAFLVGEAAGLVSPSSGEGISYALESASLFSAAFLAHPADPLPGYRKSLSGLTRSIGVKHLKAGLLSVPRIRRMIMRAGMCAVHTRPSHGPLLPDPRARTVDNPG